MTPHLDFVSGLDRGLVPAETLQRRRRREKLDTPLDHPALLVRDIDEERRVRIREIELVNGTGHGDGFVHLVRDGGSVMGENAGRHDHDHQADKKATTVHALLRGTLKRVPYDSFA